MGEAFQLLSASTLSTKHVRKIIGSLPAQSSVLLLLAFFRLPLQTSFSHVRGKIDLRFWLACGKVKENDQKQICELLFLRLRRKAGSMKRHPEHEREHMEHTPSSGADMKKR